MESYEVWVYSYAVWGWHKHSEGLSLSAAKEYIGKIRWYWPGGVAVLPASSFGIGDFMASLPSTAVARVTS